jgi:hypothetical protein
MIKYQEDEQYLVFWETREDALPPTLTDKIPILATILKMIEQDESIKMWGRCRGKIKDNRFYYTGFVIFISDTLSIETVMNKYGKYITFTKNTGSQTLLKHKISFGTGNKNK